MAKADLTALTAERLRELLHYDRETGVFIRLVATGRHGRHRSGVIAGGVANTGYRVISVDGRGQLAHRLAWLYVTGKWPSAQIDHINGERTDNRLENLREATSAQNKQNQRVHKNNKSGYPGVCYSSRHLKWVARIGISGRTKHIGYFTSPEEAYAAYTEAKRSFHPFSTV